MAFDLLKRCKLKTIDKVAIERKIELNNTIGVTGDENGVIVSLTSFPERMYELHFTLYSLLTQSVKPAKVILWLAKDQFCDIEIPQKVLNLQKLGLTIEWTENIYSYKKLIPCLEKYPNNIIVTADDDIYYEFDWLEKLLEGHKENKGSIICHRAHKIKLVNDIIMPYKSWTKKIKGNQISYTNFFTGAGGVLYPPKCFHKDILNKELFMTLSPKADDIWFWAMCVLNKTKTYVVKNCIRDLTYVNPDRERGLNNETTLFSTNKKGGNDLQLTNILNHYPQILDIIRNQ